MKKIIIAVVLLTPCLLWAQTRYYVRAGAAGSGNSWSDATGDLQEVLQTAVSGDEIRVAQGHYLPTGDGNRNLSFELPSGVALLGGFSANPLNPDERDWDAFPSVLSGNIGNPADSADNSFNVLYLFEPDSFTLVEGLIIRDGVANDSFVFSYGGINDRPVCGGGIYIDGYNGDAYPTIRHCRIEHNIALRRGGGVFVIGDGPVGSAAPRMEYCVMADNTCPGGLGGGMFHSGGSAVERGAALAHCTFTRNHAYAGGGLYFRDVNGDDQIDFFGCTFTQNTATKWGGGAYLYPPRPEELTIRIDSCAFLQNVAATTSALEIFTSGNNLFGQVHLAKCLFSGNVSTASGSYGTFNIDAIGNLSSEIHVTQCTFLNNTGSQAGSYPWGSATLYFYSNTLKESTRFISGGDLNSTIISHIYGEYNGIYATVSTPGNQSKIWLTNSFIALSKAQSVVLYVEVCDDALISNCLFRAPFPSNKAYSNGINAPVYLKNSSIDIPSFSFSNGPTHISHCYIRNFDCAATPSNFYCEGPVYSGDELMYVAPSEGDYRLSPCSPLVHAGTMSVADQVGTTDLNGQPRVLGRSIDIGPFETALPTLQQDIAVSPSCSTAPTGSVLPVPEQFCPPVAVAWTRADGTGGTDTQHLSPGAYDLALWDAKGDTVLTSFVVPALDPVLSVETTPVDCAASLPGTIIPHIEGAQWPFVFSWSDGSTDSLNTQLPAGSHSLSVTDARGCFASASATVGKSGFLHISTDLEPLLCHNDSSAVISVTPLSGIPPFQWIWDNGDTLPALSNLPAGMYSGKITDLLGCAANWIIPVENPDDLSVGWSLAPATGPQASDGSIALFISNGLPPFSVLWSNGDTSWVADSLPAGQHSVTISDANGCTSTRSIVLSWVSPAGEPANAAAQVWPNPSDGTLFTRWNTPDDGIFTLFQVNGAAAFGPLPLQPSLNTFHLQHLPAGTYLWSIQTPRHTFRGRWVRR